MMDGDRHIFFNEFTTEDEKIALKYGYHAHGSSNNLGIAEAYKSLLAIATGDLFLFLENDWELIADPRQQIYEAAEMLRNGVLDLAKLRHRAVPGHPLWSRQFEGHEMDRPEFLLDSVHWTNPDKFEPVVKMDDWFMTTARHANWTNNPHMARTEWLRTFIAPRATGDIERQLQPWWEQQVFVIGQSEGLFTHNRIG